MLRENSQTPKKVIEEETINELAFFTESFLIDSGVLAPLDDEDKDEWSKKSPSLHFVEMWLNNVDFRYMMERIFECEKKKNIRKCFVILLFSEDFSNNISQAIVDNRAENKEETRKNAKDRVKKIRKQLRNAESSDQFLEEEGAIFEGGGSRMNNALLNGSEIVGRSRWPERIPRSTESILRRLFEERVLAKRDNGAHLGEFTRMIWETDPEFVHTIKHHLAKFTEQERQDALRDVGFPDPMYFAQQI